MQILLDDCQGYTGCVCQISAEEGCVYPTHLEQDMPCPGCDIFGLETQETRGEALYFGDPDPNTQ